VKYSKLLLTISILTLLYSCQSHENKEAPTYTVRHSDFEDFLTIDGYVEAVQTISVSCPREADGIVTYLIKDGTYANQDDVVCTIEDKEVKKRYDEAIVNLETAKADLNKSKADLDLQYALLEAQVKNNAAETDIADLDSLQLKYLSPNLQRIKKLELEKVAIEKHKLEKKLKSLAIINQSEIKKSEFEIQRLTSSIQSSKEQLDGLVLKAPHKGMIYRSTYYTGAKVKEGDNVWNNMPVVTIPDLTKMKVKIIASEGNYKRININDAVELTFDAMPKNKAWGKILSKSPVGQPIKENSKIKTFEIEATIDSSLVIPGPGLSANCKVIIKQIKNALVIPVIAIFEKDSLKVVYLKKAGKYEMRQVISGATSPKSAVITSGLHLNEQISLLEPKSTLVEKKTWIGKPIKKSTRISTKNHIKKT
jgi:HlyD family secretion protein